MDTFVWVKAKSIVPGTCAKLNVPWQGPYRVREVLQDGIAYVLEDLFTGQVLQRSAEKIKSYLSRYEIVPEREEQVEPLPENREPPPQVRRPPRRLIEEV